MGIVGTDQIAWEHLKVIEAVKGVTAAGITSRTISKAEEVADIFHIDRVPNTTDLLMEECAPDALMVLVSANQIFEVTQKLIPIGVPLFIKKPPC